MFGDGVLHLLGFSVPKKRGGVGLNPCRCGPRLAPDAVSARPEAPPVASLPGGREFRLPSETEILPTVAAEGLLAGKQAARLAMLRDTGVAGRAMNGFFEGETGFASEQDIRTDHCRKLDAILREFDPVSAARPCGVPAFPGEARLVSEAEAGIDDLRGLAGALRGLLEAATVAGSLSGVTPGFVGMKSFSHVVCPDYTSAAYLLAESGAAELLLGVGGGFRLNVRSAGAGRASIDEVFATYQSLPLRFGGQEAGLLCFSLNPAGPPSRGEVNLRTGEIAHQEALLVWAPGLRRPVPWTLHYEGILLKTNRELETLGVPSLFLGFGESVVPAEIPILGGSRALLVTSAGCVGDRTAVGTTPPAAPKPLPPDVSQPVFDHIKAVLSAMKKEKEFEKALKDREITDDLIIKVARTKIDGESLPRDPSIIGFCAQLGRAIAVTVLNKKDTDPIAVVVQKICEDKGGK